MPGETLGKKKILSASVWADAGMVVGQGVIFSVGNSVALEFLR